MNIQVKRGDIVEVDLSGSVGVEKANDDRLGARPCVIVQNDKGNQNSPMTIVVPITGMEQYKPQLPIQVRVTPEDLGPGGSESVIECGHVRTIDADKRVRKHLGTLSESAMRKVDRALAISLGIRILN